MSPELITAGKYIGSVSAALYGVWATLTDFHEIRNGQRHLTRTGRFAIVLLIASSFLNIFSDRQKEIQQQHSDADEITARQALVDAQAKTNRLATIQLGKATEAATQLQATQTALQSTSKVVSAASRNTLSTLGIAKKLSEPLGEPLFYVYVAVKSSVATQAFARRYESNHTRAWNLVQGDPSYPDVNDSGERTLSVIASLEGFEVRFLTFTAGKAHTHLVYDSRCQPRRDQQDNRAWDWDYFQFNITCGDDDPYTLEDDKTMRSRLDLSGKTMFILLNPEGYSGDQPLSPSIRNTPIDIDHVDVLVGSAHWRIRGFTRCGELCFRKVLTNADITNRLNIPD